MNNEVHVHKVNNVRLVSEATRQRVFIHHNLMTTKSIMPAISLICNGKVPYIFIELSELLYLCCFCVKYSVSLPKIKF